MEKYYTYSSFHKDLIDKSGKCYCFYCKSGFSPNDITTDIDNHQTALCLMCEVDTVLPNSIKEEINQELIDSLNECWF